MNSNSLAEWMNWRVTAPAPETIHESLILATGQTQHSLHRESYQHQY
jgi:hypothetical protein